MKDEKRGKHTGFGAFTLECVQDLMEEADDLTAILTRCVKNAKKEKR